MTVDSVRDTLEQENALLRDLVQRRADEAAAAWRQVAATVATANDLAERLGQIADLCDEADSEAEQIGWSLGGLVATGELRAVIGSAAISAPATGGS